MVFLTFQLLYQAPVLVTLTRIGNHCVVDATPEEESCSSASLPSTTTDTARPVFKNLVANTAYVELDLGEDGEDVD